MSRKTNFRPNDPADPRQSQEQLRTYRRKPRLLLVTLSSISELNDSEHLGIDRKTRSATGLQQGVLPI